MTKKQKLYIETALANPTLPDYKIGEMCNISGKQISIWHQDPEFEAAIDKRIKEQWHDAVKIAKETMINLAASGDRQAAAYILDSNGFKPTENVNVNAEISAISIKIIDED